MDTVIYTPKTILSRTYPPLMNPPWYLSPHHTHHTHYSTAIMAEKGKLIIGFETNCVPDLNTLLDDGETQLQSEAL